MNTETKSPSCRDLLDLAKRLREPDGCPWDREQDLRTLTPYLLEETHEVMEAIEGGDPGKLKEELGDLLFLTVFCASLAEEKKLFSLQDVITAATDKILFRHPHVFGEPTNISSDAARKQWENIKRREKKETKERHLKAGAASLPALLYALRIQQKASSHGFDWDEADSIHDKIDEELAELRDAARANPQGRRATEEMGDVLFTIVNLSRHLNQDPERALRGTVHRFCERFNAMAGLMEDEGLSLEAADLQTMDAYWERAKTSALPNSGGADR